MFEAQGEYLGVEKQEAEDSTEFVANVDESAQELTILAAGF